MANPWDVVGTTPVQQQYDPWAVVGQENANGWTPVDSTPAPKLQPGETVDALGRPGRMVPTKVWANAAGAKVNYPANLDPKTAESLARQGFKPMADGKPVFKLRKVVYNDAGGVDVVGTAKDMALSYAHGLTDIADFFIDLPDAGHMLMTEGPGAALKAMSQTPLANTLGLPEPQSGAGTVMRTVGQVAPTPLAAGGKAFRILTTAKRADRTLRDIEMAATHMVADGHAPVAAAKMAMKGQGWDVEGVTKLAKMAGRKMYVPRGPKEAAAVLEAKGFGYQSWVRKTFSDLIRPVYDRVRTLSPRLYERLQRMELSRNMLNKELFESGSKFTNAWYKLSRDGRRVVKRALLNEDFTTVESVMGKQAVKDWRETSKLFLKRQLDAGIKVDPIKNWFPRVLRDFEGLKHKLGNDKYKLDLALQEAEKAKKAPLTAEEQANIATRFILGSKKTKLTGPQTQYKRSWEQIPEWALKYYEDPHVALARMSQSVSKHVVTRRFLGYVDAKNKGFVKLMGRGEHKGKILDTDTSIADFVANQKLPALARKEIEDVLRARLVSSEEPAHKIIQGIRNLTYTTTIANIRSGLTQAKDLGIAWSRYGLVDTVHSMFPGAKIKPIDLGINIAAKEMEASGRATARYMERSLKWSGFQAMDMYGKRVQLNAAWRQLQKLSKSGKDQRFWRDWGPVYGEEAATKILADAKAGRMTPEVKTHLFNELTEVQPITFGQTPKLFAAHPNARIFYTMNTFSIRQLNTVFNAIRAERNVTKGAQMAMRYATIMGLSGMTVDQIKGMMTRAVTPENFGQELAANFGFNVLGIMLLSRWYVDNAGKEGPLKSYIENIGTAGMAPFKLFDNVLVGAWKLALEGDPHKLAKAMKSTPILAPLYWWVAATDQEIKQRQK